jgi:hypothetical protein
VDSIAAQPNGEVVKDPTIAPAADHFAFPKKRHRRARGRRTDVSTAGIGVLPESLFWMCAVEGSATVPPLPRSVAAYWGFV